jgi:glycosyltransferase involved in cell wall biosynthesis
MIKIIGFGADSALKNIYKGWSYLQDALRILAEDESLKYMCIEIVIFGSNYNKSIADKIPFPAHFLGHLNDELTLVMMYNMLDVFVCPSLAEAFGQTILESLVCNVPVVGFDVGGITDMVNIDTGYLAKYKDSVDLANGISLLLKNPKSNVNEYIKTFYLDAILEKHKQIIDKRS